MGIMVEPSLEQDSPSNIKTKQVKPKRKTGRRTARACDECRLRKSRCDGLEPCEACQSSDRCSGTRIRILEDRLRRARAYLAEAQKRTPSLANVNFEALLGPTEEGARALEDEKKKDDENGGVESVDSMLSSYGQMTDDPEDGGVRNFYGASSGFAWIHRANEYLDGSSDESINGSDAATIQLFDAPLPPKHDFDVSHPPMGMLPSRDTASQLLNVVFTKVYPLYHFLDEEDFHEYTDRLYSKRPSRYDEQDQQFLSLFYLVIGLGYLFSRQEHDNYGCRDAVRHAMRYFIAGRGLSDIAHLRTIFSLQAIVALVIFLISTARVASAHAYVGVACAAAMRQGLHFRSAHENFPDKETRLRRKVLWTVINLDMYVCGILGLPPFMDIDGMDSAIDLTTNTALADAKNNRCDSSEEAFARAGSAKHIQLLRLKVEALRTLFPAPQNTTNAQARKTTITVSVKTLQKFVLLFREWAQSTAAILRASPKTEEAICVQYELTICYYFTQIQLYRAFLHYLAIGDEESFQSKRQLSYAKICVRMAKEAITLSMEHQRKGLLCPASWPSVYCVFSSVVCLIFAAAAKADRCTTDRGTTDQNVLPEINDGIRLLACTACTTDTGSVRCLEILRRLIKRVRTIIDIDVDGVCAATSTCCTLQLTPRDKNRTMNYQQIDTSAVDDEHGRRSTSAATTESTSSSSALIAQHGIVPYFTLSPEVTMTQGRYSYEQNTLQTINSNGQYVQTQPYSEQVEDIDVPDELMEVPLMHSYNWAGQTTQTTSVNPNSNIVTSQTTPSLEENRYMSPDMSRQHWPQPFGPRQSRLTDEDIAAFVHAHPGDEPFIRRGG